ncbi:uncharacterized protein BYT42DRAFT_645008 [Radiomyces spectabilis]|uniref:uncharacterized protein n=1 Tax=Radiomyces spectabilis TaxID=64574 RepID=UPI00222092A2|nr:uncharacterized protein BYT42DRAFT_645008 [Radiomyces spectabilis]KAI8379801.1 hypothetical protein BYT42DRAFT_645008 [Radiomyces spectabilis]
MATSSALPSFRQKRNSFSNLNVPRRFHIPLLLLRAFCLLPYVFGVFHNTKAAWSIVERDAGGALVLQSSATDYWLANGWCVLAGYWCWILTTNLMRRWLYLYSVANASFRIVTLIIVNGLVTALVQSYVSVDQPIKVWFTVSCFLLVANILRLRFDPRPKHSEKTENLHNAKIDTELIAAKMLALTFFFMIGVTMLFTLFQIDALNYTSTQLMHPSFALADQLPADASIIVVILSSWSTQAMKRRQQLRQTSLKLIPHENVQYRFVIGQSPSARDELKLRHTLQEESQRFKDLLLVPTSDLRKDRGRKLLEALRWSTKNQYNYLIKTDDNVFVRWDTVISELQTLGPQTAYWKGLTYRNMPPNAFREKAIDPDYGMPILPTFVSGNLIVLSYDTVQYAVGIPSPHRFLADDAQSLAVWLFGYNIQPQHDLRVQDINVCEEDQVAKRFDNGKLYLMETMYNNIKAGASQCNGLDTSKCAVCYPCHGKKDDWRSMNLACDPFKGVTLRQQKDFTKVSGSSVKDDLLPSQMTSHDEWIIKDILSPSTSVYSDTEDWHLLYWVCWTSDASTFTDRHWRALELVWIHEPRAVIFMLSNTLSQDFFSDYKEHGYNIQVVHFNKENLLRWHWYFGSGTKDWLLGWDEWEKGSFFYWHLTDYIRLLLLYNYGGTYMDMDALWVRIPPDPTLEFIGSDYSSIWSDREWTLDKDGLYLPQGLMRFKRGWKLFREMAENAFSAYTYDPQCFNCGGPKAITTYVREHRQALEANGFNILPREVLYPVSYLDIHKLLEKNSLAEQELKTKIMPNSWNIHLFGKMTNHLPIESGSVIDMVFRQFDLDIPHRDAKTQAIISSNGAWSVPMKLVGPQRFIYRAPSFVKTRKVQQAAPGKFHGLDVVYVRGGPAIVDEVRIEVAVERSRFEIQGYAHPLSTVSIELQRTTKSKINQLLNSLVYVPERSLVNDGGTDTMTVKVIYPTEKAELKMNIVVVESAEGDDLIEDL